LSGVLYEVTVEVEPALVEAFVRYMTEKHIPEIYATGCFRRVRFDRAGPTTLRTSYQAATAADLERYLQQHTAAFRADFAAHFPTGVTPSRVTWSGIAAWE
jgi:ribosomal protein L12E/L44/L45/RPP1/RPP2